MGYDDKELEPFEIGIIVAFSLIALGTIGSFGFIVWLFVRWLLNV